MSRWSAVDRLGAHSCMHSGESEKCGQPALWRAVRVDGYVEGPLRLIWPFFPTVHVEDEALKGAQMPKPSAGNDDRAIVVATFCWTTVPLKAPPTSDSRKGPVFVRWRDHDPSRIALSHGNGDFGQRAWRDHAELPDSAAELPLLVAAGILRAGSDAVDLSRDRSPLQTRT